MTTRSADRPIELKPEKTVNIDMRTLWGVLTFVAIAAFVGAKVYIGQGNHDERLTAIEKTISSDHDIGVKHTSQIEAVTKALDTIDKKLDYLTGARGFRPTAPAVSAVSSSP